MKRLLIINADDFGYSHTVNVAIQRAHREGILTSASLMVGEEGFEEAVEMAREMPALGVGLHLTLTLDTPVLPAKTIPHIVTPQKKLESDPFRAGLRYTFSKTAQRELFAEMEAQFARFAQTGLDWSHVDGHQHFHLPPIVWDEMLRLCVQYGVRRIRYPYEPILDHLRSGGQSINLDTIAALIFRLLRKRNLGSLRRYEQKSGQTFFLCGHVYGHLQTGQMSEAYTLKLLERLKETTSEVYFHPGANHAHLLPLEQQTEGVKDVELHALLSPKVLCVLTSGGFQLGSYAQTEAMLKSITQ
ncbi:MAG: hopanoid biosynthesis-associated protein HpnK [Armatimonadetes bacterium]|nr:hopanoid biosynthesis-associated protein HpnK [Armatimonadota bacterium]